MRSRVDKHSDEAEKAVRDIRPATRRQYSAEEKVRIVIAGLRGEDSVAELCRKEGVCGKLVILTEDRAAAQTCGTIGEG